MSEAILHPLGLLLPQEIIDALSRTAGLQGRTVADVAARVLAKWSGLVATDLPNNQTDVIEDNTHG